MLGLPIGQTQLVARGQRRLLKQLVQFTSQNVKGDAEAGQET